MAHGPPGAAARSPPTGLTVRSGGPLPRRRVAVLGGGTLVLAIAALALLGRPGSDYRHSDFFQFWAAPRLLLEGSDPYDGAAWSDIYAREAASPVATPPPPGRHIYPPWSAVPLLPLGALPFPLAAAVWLAGQIAVVVVALLAFARAAGCGRREVVLLFGFAAAFQPLWLIAGGGNVTGYMLGAFVAALLLAARRPIASGAALGVLALKPHPFVIAVPALLAAVPPSARPRVALSAIAAVAVLIATTLPFGLSLSGEWLAAAAALQITTGSNATVWTIGRVLPGGALLAAVLAAGATVSLVVWWRAVERPQLDRVAGAICVSLFVAPHGWSYDQVLLLLPLAIVLRDLDGMTARLRSFALPAVAAVAVVVPWALYALAWRRGGEEWSALTPMLFFAMVVAAGLAAQRPERAP